MCDTTRKETPPTLASLDELPTCKLLPTTRRIQDANVLSLEVNNIPLWNLALKAHYGKNTHHPEHFSDASQMDELSRKHMLCDLLASFWASQRKQSRYDKWTLPKVANVCKDWPKWKYVQDLYTGSYDEESSEIPKFPRWSTQQYQTEKFRFKTLVKSFLCNIISMKEFIEGLHAFDCVIDYMNDLRWHQQTIVEVGKALFPEDEALHADLASHDDDKWDALMITAYVWKWMFEEEVMELDQRFDGTCTPCLISGIVEKGKEELKKMYIPHVKV